MPIELVLRPTDHIVMDVFGENVQFIIISDDSVVETRLPCERNIVLLGETGDGLFELSDNNRQPRLHLCCLLNGF